MTDRVEITIPVDIQRFSQNVSHRDWTGRHMSAKKARRIGRAAWLKAGSPVMAPPVRVSVIVRRGRLIDYWNIPGACKGLIDGLFNKAITPNDGPKCVLPGAIIQEQDASFKGHESVTFIVERIEE